MAYRCCKNHSRECDGCMDCQPDITYYCPLCGDEVQETVYVTSDGDVIGCENCVEAKDPEDVLNNEA